MTGKAAPGRLIGSGRAADVYELDGGRVLRRYRIKADVGHEARVMRYLWSAGFPVPEVYDAGGTDIVMARLRGTDMLTDLTRRPWLARHHAGTLARMHDKLHEIEAPPWLPRPLEHGDRVIHLDLHPGNVVLTETGPVVIDWSNGAAGPPGADVAMASLIMAVSEVDEMPKLIRLVAGSVRRALVRGFEQRVSAEAAPYLAAAARLRIADRNVRPAEVATLRRIADGRQSR
jgi:aminoglycoside phosphotransferase (APT) family kinase protein